MGEAYVSNDEPVEWDIDANLPMYTRDYLSMNTKHRPESQNSTMDFGAALDFLKVGGKVSREGWNGKGQFLELQRPDHHSKMTLPYIFITTVRGDRVPWIASQTDLMAEDWVYVDIEVWLGRNGL